MEKAETVDSLTPKIRAFSRSLKEYKYYVCEFQALQDELERANRSGDAHVIKKTKDLVEEAESVIKVSAERLASFANSLDAFIKCNGLTGPTVDAAKEELKDLSVKFPSVGYIYKT